jgi:hypothetical protein
VRVGTHAHGAGAGAFQAGVGAGGGAAATVGAQQQGVQAAVVGAHAQPQG